MAEKTLGKGYMPERIILFMRIYALIQDKSHHVPTPRIHHKP